MEEKASFKAKFQRHRNSRVYFFIILLYAKNILNEEQIKQFGKRFIEVTYTKIANFVRDVSNSIDDNFKRFRNEEIADLRYAIDSMIGFFTKKIEFGVELLYKKEKHENTIKSKNYVSAIKIIKEI